MSETTVEDTPPSPAEEEGRPLPEDDIALRICGGWIHWRLLEHNLWDWVSIYTRIGFDCISIVSLCSRRYIQYGRLEGRHACVVPNWCRLYQECCQYIRCKTVSSSPPKWFGFILLRQLLHCYQYWEHLWRDNHTIIGSEEYRCIIHDPSNCTVRGSGDIHLGYQAICKGKTS